MGKLKTAAATAVSVFQTPATLVVSDAMETGASGTSSVSLMEAPTGVEGDSTGPTSAMQVSSSDEGFVAPGGNNGIGVIEHPSPLPPVPTTPASAISNSSDDASAGGAQKNSEIHLNSSMNVPPAQ